VWINGVIIYGCAIKGTIDCLTYFFRGVQWR